MRQYLGSTAMILLIIAGLTAYDIIRGSRMASPQTIYLQSGATVTVERGETLRLLKAAAPRLGYSIDNALGKTVITWR